MRRKRGHPEEPPYLVLDGSGEIREAMVEVYGKAPRYGGRERSSGKKRARGGGDPFRLSGSGREARWWGRLKGLFWGRGEALSMPGKSTADVERMHLTSRPFNSRLARKTSGYSKVLASWGEADASDGSRMNGPCLDNPRAFDDCLYPRHQQHSSKETTKQPESRKLKANGERLLALSSRATTSLCA